VSTTNWFFIAKHKKKRKKLKTNKERNKKLSKPICHIEFVIPKRKDKAFVIV